MYEPDFLPDDYRKRRFTRWLRSAMESTPASKMTFRFKNFAERAVARPGRSAVATAALAMIAASAFRLAVGSHSGPGRSMAATVAPAQRLSPLHESQPPAALSAVASVPWADSRVQVVQLRESARAQKIDNGLGKSGTILSDVEQRKQAQDFIAQAESQLHLQSILAGPRPRALVNGKVVERGDVVASYRVLEIERRRIIVEREGIRLEIPIH